MSLEEFGNWLAELSPTISVGAANIATARRAGCYSVQTYLHVKEGGITDCPAGTYYYHPLEHGLVPLTLGAQLDPAIHEPFTNRPIFEQARFSLFFVSQPAAIEPMYGDLAARFSLLEAGAMAHAIESSAWRFGLGVCPIGLIDFAAIRALFHLEMDKSCFTPMSEGLWRRRRSLRPQTIATKVSYDRVELLSNLRNRGVRLWVEGADLRFSAPKGAARLQHDGAADASQGGTHRTLTCDADRSFAAGQNEFKVAKLFARRASRSIVRGARLALGRPGPLRALCRSLQRLPLSAHGARQKICTGRRLLPLR